LMRVRGCGDATTGGSGRFELALWQQREWATKSVLGVTASERHHTPVHSTRRREALSREWGYSAVGLAEQSSIARRVASIGCCSGSKATEGPPIRVSECRRLVCRYGARS